LSDLLFVTSTDAVEHLSNEGIPVGQIFFVGNPMIDTLLAHLDEFDAEAARKQHGIAGPYVVMTVHRPSNVDDRADAAALVSAVHAVADQVQVLLPLHPRGRQRLGEAGLMDHPRLKVIDPVGYFEFLGLVRGASAVITDSGGVQEETTVMGIPCLTLRPNTERPVTITSGTNRLVARAELADHVRQTMARGKPDSWPTPPLWDGQAGQRIADVLAKAVGV
jgi:UDP-N-acetylglucosamine 2-epimerase (non-hydrolysing)